MRSQLLLFQIGILAHIWPAQRVKLLRRLQYAIAREAENRGDILKLSLRPRHGSPLKSTFAVRLRVGNRADYQSLWECLNDSIYDPPQVPIRHVLDGGANIGFFTIASAQLPGIKDVIMVEPDSSNLKLLDQNTAFLPSSQIIEAALSNHEGTAQFEIADSNTSRLQGAPGHAQSLNTVTVPCKRLTDVLPQSWDMNHTWLKLDIEGAEYDVLRDMLQTELRPIALSIEVHEYPTAGGADLVNELSAAGYQVRILDPGDERNVCRQVSAIYSQRNRA